MTSKKRVVEQEYFYGVSPEIVYRALTEPAELAKWFVSKAKFKPKEGRSYTLVWSGGASHTGKVLKVVPNRKLVLSWPDEIEGKLYETEATFTMKKKEKGTLLKVKHTGFKKGSDWVWLFGAVQSGWAYYLTNLKSVLAQGVDLRSKHDNP
jgi:uncharacterized protein YndB with AHSA1/START domain